MSKTIEDLKAELNAAIADHNKITSRASSIPARREQAARDLHDALKAQARGGDGSAVDEAHASLKSLDEEERLAGYEADAAKERVFEAEIVVADAEYTSATKEAEEVFETVLEARSEREHFQRLERERLGRFTDAEGRANRALRSGKDAANRLEEFRVGRQTRKEQTLVDSGVAPRPRQQRRSEVVFDTLR